MNCMYLLLMNKYATNYLQVDKKKCATWMVLWAKVYIGYNEYGLKLWSIMGHQLKQLHDVNAQLFIFIWKKHMNLCDLEYTMNVNFYEIMKTGIHDILLVTKCATSRCNGTGDYSTNYSCHILVISSLLGDIVLHVIVASLPGLII